MEVFIALGTSFFEDSDPRKVFEFSRFLIDFQFSKFFPNKFFDLQDSSSSKRRRQQQVPKILGMR